MSWNGAVAQTCVKQIMEAVFEVMAEQETNDSWEVRNDVGEKILNVLYETYGEEDEWKGVMG